MIHIRLQLPIGHIDVYKEKSGNFSGENFRFLWFCSIVYVGMTEIF